MITINNDKTIGITRGDVASFTLKVKQSDDTYYQFKTTDTLYFTVKKSYADSNYIIRKTITFNSPTETATISFNANDTNKNGIIDNDEKSGNFINAIERLDEIKESGINTLHLLPITPVGKLKALGTAGSLYAIDNFHS